MDRKKHIGGKTSQQQALPCESRLRSVTHDRYVHEFAVVTTIDNQPPTQLALDSRTKLFPPNKTILRDQFAMLNVATEAQNLSSSGSLS